MELPASMQPQAFLLLSGTPSRGRPEFELVIAGDPPHDAWGQVK
jgi:hypothetical protein